MYKKINPLFLLCETPLHAGSGDDLGMVDLPIQRERHTSFPKIEGSSLKGALREAFETKVNSKAFNNWDDDDVKIHRFFGYDDGSLKSGGEESPKRKLEAMFKDASEYSGCLAFTDARILLFPVKSMKGVFVWITCQQVLNKFASDLGIAGCTAFSKLNAAIAATKDLTNGGCLVSDISVCINKNVVLEEYAFAATAKNELKELATELADNIFSDNSLSYWCGLLKTNLVVLSDDDFRDFVNQSTEVITRTKINNETGTVQDGALFTEEYLPTDSVMYSLVMASKEYGKKATATDEDAMSFFSDNRPPIFQLGGNATIGKGLLRTYFLTTNH
ncbi:MAG: type III-B CRISPR module RAMP protein Cmr4 [Saprospiraceae bacterium]|nr:type III-B CRISPR module RAMP protein Cmr4 [Saprospiraceae bacterium]